MTDPRLTPAAASEAILDAERRGVAIVEILATDGPHAGRRLLVAEDGAELGSLGTSALDAAARTLAATLLDAGDAVTEVTDGTTLFATPYHPSERLVIVGAGHIAVPLAGLGVRLGFEVLVLDDREEFATAERFPDEAEVSRCDFAADPFAGVRIDTRTYVALVTRGHRWDFDCLQRLVAARARPRYIGMIGSRRRVRAALLALRRAGVPREVLERIRAPIGLEIGAETPEEIAVSIAAEMVAVRRGVGIESMTTRERVLDRLLPEGEEANG